AIIYSHYITNCGVTWSGSSGESWDTETNWTPNQVPTEATDVIIPKTSVYPEIPENTTVKTITFKHGAEIGNQQNLTITGKAFIELDLAPGRWHLLSMPVAAISRDFYFEEGPSSWIRTFITTADNANKAGWKYITNLDKTFEIGDGFAFWVGTKEDTENQKIMLEGTALSNGSETKSLDFGENSGSYFALAGNPFMTTIDFDKLAENNTSIVNSYLIWTEEGGFSGYNKSGTFGISGGLTEHIAPLQSFIVEKTSESSPVTLNFDLEKIQATGSGELKADEKTAGNKLDIIASNPAASVLTFIANREDGQSSRKLFSTMSNLPDIYTLNGTTALGANIIHTGDILVPVGLATAYTGNMNLIFKGMDNYDARISFLDVVADREIDITGLSVYEYSFNYTPKKENDQVVAEENRFFVRIQPSSTGLTNHLSGEAFVYSKDHVVFAVSGFSDLIQKIRIYNTQGLLIYADDNIKAPSYTVNCSVNIPEICIVKLITEQGTKSVKLLVK
ncbi:MAG: hypothetical protein LBG15_15850, partial [Dysgonamonadaceae bacterium]|nr:hypothetical protein [Dysgonamonadaceae bacterium]